MFYIYGDIFYFFTLIKKGVVSFRANFYFSFLFLTKIFIIRFFGEDIVCEFNFSIYRENFLFFGEDRAVSALSFFFFFVIVIYGDSDSSPR